MGNARVRTAAYLSVASLDGLVVALPWLEPEEELDGFEAARRSTVGPGRNVERSSPRRFQDCDLCAYSLVRVAQDVAGLGASAGLLAASSGRDARAYLAGCASAASL